MKPTVPRALKTLNTLLNPVQPEHQLTVEVLLLTDGLTSSVHDALRTTCPEGDVHFVRYGYSDRPGTSIIGWHDRSGRDPAQGHSTAGIVRLGSLCLYDAETIDDVTTIRVELRSGRNTRMVIRPEVLAALIADEPNNCCSIRHPEVACTAR